MNSGYFGTIGGADAGSLDNRFPGMLGQTVVYDNKAALKASKTSVGTLFQGVYQLVKFATAVTTVTRGQILCWDTLANNGIANFSVTATPTAATPKAGIALFTDSAAGGKFGYIQVAGLASVLFGNTLGAAGSAAVQGTAADTPLLTATTATTFLDATAIASAAFMKAYLGVTYETSLTNSAINRVLLSPLSFYVNVG